MTDAAAIAALEMRLCDEPYDWQAWSVYGDWLLDIGDPRGELIAMEQAGVARERIATLEQELAAEANLHSGVLRACEWMHGFVLAGTLAIDYADDIDDLRRALAARHARLLREVTLDIGPKVRAQDLAGLATLPLACVRKLSLTEQARGDVGLRSLVGACTRLVEVDCRGAGLTHNGAVALAELAAGGTLRHLHLQRNRIRGKGVALLAPTLVGLELLDLRDNEIGATGLAALARTPALGQLRTLRLQLGTFASDDLRVLAESTTLPLAIVRYVRGVLEQRKKAT